jgi:hypothetical protein
MRKSTFIVGAVALLAVGALFASNMGFKLNYALTAAGGGSLNGTNTLGLPFNPQVGISNASTLVNDIGSASVINVQRLIESSNALQVYPTDGVNFPLVIGDGYYVRMGATVNYIVVGSHHPTQMLPLNAAGGGISLNGTNFVSYPYHSTSDLASELVTEIGSASVVNVQRLIESNNGLQVYPTDGVNFPLVPGESYFVRMGANVLTWIPAHY